MDNKIALGTNATLDLQTRSLIRTHDGYSVSLPASACMCLKAMVEAHGEVLSQEQLMDIGWRRAGVEVTENSVRVMINKLRRAINIMELQDTVTLLAVTRSGYRLIIREPGTNPEPSVQSVQSGSAEKYAVHDDNGRRTTPVSQTAAGRSPAWFVKLFIMGALTGLVIALILTVLLRVDIPTVTFVPWQGPGVPQGTQVRVPSGKASEQELIQATLSTYTNHVLTRRPGEKPASILYITLGAGKLSKYQGVIACHRPVEELKNGCESFYFRIR